MWMANSKSNCFSSYFHENGLNVFKTWESTREIMNISKKRKSDITSIEIVNKTVKKSLEINSVVNEFNKYFISIDKQIEEKSVKRNINTVNM